MVGAKPIARCRRERWISPSYIIGVVRGDQRGEDRGEHNDQQHNGAEERIPVAQQQANPSWDAKPAAL
jgi:hypothetical protein